MKHMFADALYYISYLQSVDDLLSSSKDTDELLENDTKGKFRWIKYSRFSNLYFNIHAVIN